MEPNSVYMYINGFVRILNQRIVIWFYFDIVLQETFCIINPIELCIESNVLILQRFKHVLFELDNILHKLCFVLIQSMMYYTALSLY